jgi:hypothetical protein
MRMTAALLVLLCAAPVPAAGEAPSQQSDSEIPIPRQKPKGLVGTKKLAPAPKWQADTGDWPEGMVKAARAACASLLAGRDITFTPQQPIGKQGGCGAPAPVEIASIAGVTLTPPAIVTCPMAARLHDWVTGALQPAAQKKLKTRVTGITTASSYVCRRRNNSSSGKLSEHGKANALDMSGFTFAKAKGVTVEDGWGGILRKIGLSKEGGFLDAARQGACLHFSTVLGPGSDPHHGDHFHVDAIERKNDYRICK